MPVSETSILRSEISELRKAIVAYGVLADYVSQYPQHGWMELDACHSILFKRIEAVKTTLAVHLFCGFPADRNVAEFAKVERMAKIAFRMR